MNNTVKITKSVLKATLKKANLIGQLENLIIYHPWLPDGRYREGVLKIVRKIEKLNEKMGMKEDIIVSGITFYKCGC